MALTVAQLAERCKAQIAGGDPQRTLTGANNLRDAGPADLAPLTDPRYAPLLAASRAGAVLIAPGIPHPPAPEGVAVLQAADTEGALLAALHALYPEVREAPGVHPQACVEAGAKLGAEVYVGPFAVIRAGAVVGDGCEIHAGAYVGPGCKLGKRCVVHPRAVLYPRVELGDETILHAGAVVGADGFGYKFREGRLVKVPQVGGVTVGARVEIGANSAVDRAALGQTTIGEGSKLDNLVQIGHNVRLGKHVIVCGQAGVAGSSTVQDYAMLGAQSGIPDHITIGMAAKVGGQSGPIDDVPPKGEVFGTPAAPRREAFRQFAALRKLPELLKEVRELRARLEKLERSAD
ncbi:MAG: UDP-3-O-acylglucosamine N-acyltransferase [Planctomycetota bacterium]